MWIDMIIQKSIIKDHLRKSVSYVPRTVISCRLPVVICLGKGVLHAVGERKELVKSLLLKQD